jgi:hypothetical protein
MAAKRLARTSGMDYAILSGGDVAPLGGGAVTQVRQQQPSSWASRLRVNSTRSLGEAGCGTGSQLRDPTATSSICQLDRQVDVIGSLCIALHLLTYLS